MTVDTVTPRSRRNLLLGALGGLAAAAAATVSGAQRVLAAGSDGEPVVIGGDYSDVRSSTTFRTSILLPAAGQQGFRFRAELPPQPPDGNYRQTTISPDGIFNNWHSSIDGRQWETTIGWGGVAVYGGKRSGAGVSAQTAAGPAIVGRSGGVGVRGGGEVGVRGAGTADGRGGAFSGGKAQVRLIPSTDAGHPESGATGDLFVDSQKRLWFCRDGSAWVRLA